jgi:hypothetical protein
MNFGSLTPTLKTEEIDTVHQKVLEHTFRTKRAWVFD